ncbi:hypothetical protein COT99_02605 [Candidatus Falkowbacteria bacterium CG10_big_fil_rev_8_21_14_0_10_43_10]|uniref:DUF3307 domain-containing protein n=1 Tax=Candidatus Falkowbacteria bacterium CG10_big_fil_rev_8_21_14_0_10_43_10 TaxID=1974567 RepID=A0A2H0V408_9BACT|nr:MAG: hypothetical protein COT99_02605 [Candidatus Falkowbacteria bacterium CG10_big_fil_rev_8_21_14_0_10_43_10]
MFLTIHATSAIVIGQAITNPAGAFFIGLVSHYVFDAIPHGDEEALDLKKIGFKNFLLLALADHIFVIINFILLFWLKPDLIITPGIIAAVLGAILPDWLGGFYQLIKRWHLPGEIILAVILKPLYVFHQSCHRQIIKTEINLAAGIALQILLLIGSWWII